MSPHRYHPPTTHPVNRLVTRCSFSIVIDIPIPCTRCCVMVAQHLRDRCLPSWDLRTQATFSLIRSETSWSFWVEQMQVRTTWLRTPHSIFSETCGSPLSIAKYYSLLHCYLLSATLIWVQPLFLSRFALPICKHPTLWPIEEHYSRRHIIDLVAVKDWLWASSSLSPEVSSDLTEPQRLSCLCLCSRLFFLEWHHCPN
jgi:hypothetical protein